MRLVTLGKWIVLGALYVAIVTGGVFVADEVFAGTTFREFVNPNVAADALSDPDSVVDADLITSDVVTINHTLEITTLDVPRNLHIQVYDADTSPVITFTLLIRVTGKDQFFEDVTASYVMGGSGGVTSTTLVTNQIFSQISAISSLSLNGSGSIDVANDYLNVGVGDRLGVMMPTLGMTLKQTQVNGAMTDGNEEFDALNLSVNMSSAIGADDIIIFYFE